MMDVLLKRLLTDHRPWRPVPCFPAQVRSRVTASSRRHHGRDRAAVYGLDLGAIEHDIEGNGELLTGDLIGWLAEGAGD
ncbi:hypothetical protein ACWD26_41840 [Streptomyces sp. NPDC002787]